MTDYQALAWITSVLRRAAFRIDRVDRKRAAMELLILDAPLYPWDTTNGGGSWVSRVIDDGPSVEEMAEANVDLDLFVRVLPPREATLVRLFASGFKVSEAAKRLGVTVRTVERERGRIAKVMRSHGWPIS